MERANLFKNIGGIIVFLSQLSPGLYDFIRNELIVKDTPACKFIPLLKNEFPRLPREYLPSLTTVKKFKKANLKFVIEEEKKQIFRQLRPEYIKQSYYNSEMCGKLAKKGSRLALIEFFTKPIIKN